jgi:hypothetical protein
LLRFGIVGAEDKAAVDEVERVSLLIWLGFGDRVLDEIDWAVELGVKKMKRHARAN